MGATPAPASQLKRPPWSTYYGGGSPNPSQAGQSSVNTQPGGLNLQNPATSMGVATGSNFTKRPWESFYNTGLGQLQNQTAALNQTAATTAGPQTAAIKSEQGTLANTAPSLQQFTNGSIQSSPFYKALLTQSRQGISDAYQNAAGASKLTGNAAGFGYASPNVQGANTELAAQEAQQYGQAPLNAMTAAVQPTLQAAGLENQQAALEGQTAGLYGQEAGQYSDIAKILDPAAYLAMGASGTQAQQANSAAIARALIQGAAQVGGAAAGGA